MHSAVHNFIREVKKETSSKYGRRSYFRFKKVLEVGSKIINGSPRKHFTWCDYTGIDLSKGWGVDKVFDICEPFILPDGFYQSYNTVISTEMLEHCSKWQLALVRMFHCVKPGGLLLITCAGPERAEHGTKRTTPECSPNTTDYYRNISKEDFKSVLPSELFSLYVLMNGRDKQDLYFYGIKK